MPRVRPECVRHGPHPPRRAPVGHAAHEHLARGRSAVSAGVDRTACPRWPDTQRPVDHGTEYAHRWGCRCPDALEIRRLRKKRRRLGRQPPAWVPAVGSRRRLWALACLGWTVNGLAARLGMPARSVVWIRTPGREQVHRDTAARIAALYDELSMTPGPSTLAAQRARAAGAHPPLAWDDGLLDDPGAEPVVTAREKLWEIAARRRTEVAVLAAAGFTADRIAARLEVTTRTVERTLATLATEQAADERGAA